MFAPEQRKTASLRYCSQLKNLLSNKVTLTVDISSNVMWLITLDGWVLMYVDADCRDWEDSTGHVRFVALRQDVQPVQRYSSESLQILRLQTGTDAAAIVSDSLLLLLLPMLSIQYNTKRNVLYSARDTYGQAVAVRVRQCVYSAIDGFALSVDRSAITRSRNLYPIAVRDVNDRSSYGANRSISREPLT